MTALNINQVIEAIMSKEAPAALYVAGSDVIEAAKELHSPDTLAIIGADYPLPDNPDAISTPLQICNNQDGVVIILQDSSQISVSEKQLAALAQFAKNQEQSK